MKIVHIQHEIGLARRHRGSYVCARLSALLALGLALFFEALSLKVAQRLFFGAAPLSLGQLPDAAQGFLLLQHTGFALIAAGPAWLALGLWKLDLRAWGIAQALCVIVPAILLFSGELKNAGAPWIGVPSLLLLLLNIGQRPFRIDISRH